MSALSEIRFKSIYNVLPPPHAHTIDIEVRFLEAHASVTMSLHYLERDTLVPEEIWEEGFSEDDDVSWSGTLPLVWLQYLESKLESPTEEQKSSPDENTKITIKTKDGQEQSILNDKKWAYLLQELLQASFEASGREHPLLLRYLRNENQNTYKCALTYFFEFLKVEIEVLENEKTVKYLCEWEASSKLLREIFMPDYIVEKAMEELSKQEGTYVDPGEGVWYKAPEAIRDGKKPYPIASIEKALHSVLQGAGKANN